MKPRLALLGLTRRTRVFVNQSAIEIIKNLLKGIGGADYRIFRPILTRQQCTQYRETDLEFFMRLCSEEGISHFWKHGPRVNLDPNSPDDDTATNGSDHQLVLTDNTTILDSEVLPIEYRGLGTPHGNRQHIDSLRLRQGLCPANFVVTDSHFQTFDQHVKGNFPPPETIDAGARRFRSVTAVGSGWNDLENSATRCFDLVDGTGPGSLASMEEAQQVKAKSLAEGCGGASLRMHATGNCNGVSAGRPFRLQGHPWADGIWLVVEAIHAVRVDGAYWAGEATVASRECRFIGAPPSLNQPPWPPIPKPRVLGVETAVVVAPRGAEANLDSFGRVKVRFWFDQERGESEAGSCWVRVAQPWAGKGYGSAFWPRAGHEVVVSFEGGDPDRPVIVGSLYNATNMPPFELPAASYLSGFKSKIAGGNPNKNYHLLILGDEPEAEVVVIHSEGTLVSQQEKERVSKRPRFEANLQG